MKVRKLLALLFSFVILLSLLLAMTLAADKSDSGAKNGNYVSYAQETVQGSAILHCFNWSYNEIREALPDIAAAGYTAVQTSPVQQPKGYDPALTDTAGQWQNLYQPLGMRIAPTVDGEATSWLGTTAELTALCTVADNYGLKVIVDIVANHVANNGESGGTYSHLNPAVDPSLKNASFYHTSTTAVSDNENDRYRLTQYHLGMPDLNTANGTVQSLVIGLLEECVECGVDGFRFDAAKHIELPTDPSNCKSDFWRNVINDVLCYAEDNGIDDLFFYGEVLGSVGRNTPASAYTEYMAVTDNESSDSARSSALGLDAAGLADGTYLKGADASKSILWAESHDDYMDGVSSGVSDDVIVKTWAIVGARADSTALFLARPSEVMGEASSDLTWKSTAVAEVNKFKNHYNGADEALSCDQDAKVAWIERGTSGVVISKLDGAGAVSLTASQMADGVYTDQVSKGRFTVSDGVITGTVGETGVAVVYNPNGTPDPIIAGGETGEVSWSLEDGVLTISGTGAMADYANYSDVPWQELGVTSAVIEDGVTNIGSNAFRNCVDMESVSIGSDVTSIGLCAFLGCESLTGVTFPASVTSIGSNAFTACTGLSEVTVPASVQTIGSSAFLSCTGLTEATVGAESIGNYAFCDCWALTTLTLSDSVKSIGIQAFDSCRSLKNLSLGSALETIGANAFNGSGLESVTLPASVTSLGYSAFNNCGYLKTFTAECFLTNVDASIFGGCSKLETLNFACGVKTVGAAAFNNFPNLKTVVFGEGTETIQQSAFLSCGELTTVTFPDTVTSIGPDAFRQCRKLESLALPDSLTSIDYGAFQGCSALTSLHIPAGVTSIGNNAFEGCTNLAYLCSTVPDGAAAAYCTDNNVSFRLCGMHVTLGDVTGGTVTVNAPEHLTQSETVTLAVTPDESYYVPVWTVTDANGDPVTVTNNCFLMPESDVTVSAVFGVPYLDENGTLQMLTEPVTFLTAETAADPVIGWVLVLEDLTLEGRLTVSGDARLILYDGATLTAPQGVEVPEDASLTIHAQSTGESMGALTAGSTVSGSPAIGANRAGEITINGGRIQATGYYSSGIGAMGTGGGVITINGGDITAAGNGGSGYAGVNVGAAGFVMNGGTLSATGYKYGAGIGAGYMNSCGPITINGGVINADSEQGRGIGPYADKATVTVINGGRITAKSIGGADRNAVLRVGWTDESDFVEARLLGTVTWTRHFAAADSPTEYYNDTATMASSMRLVPIEGHPGLTHVEALAPTCTAEGCVEYWLCEVCSRCYADAEGATEIDPVLPMIDHSPVYIEACAPNGAAAGCIAHYVCESCGAFFADEDCTEPLARSAVLRIPYLDASGSYAVLEPGDYEMLDEYAEANHISTGVTLYSGCYVVEGDYCENYSFSVRTDNDVKLVLCDGAHFHFPTSNNYDYFTLNNGATASFYAQSTGADMGAFGVEKNRVTVTNRATLNIYGGRFTLGSTESTFGALGCNSNDSYTGSIHIYGGEVTAMAKSASYVAIGAARGNLVEILGGTVNVIGGSISAAEVRLGWTDRNDRITASAYGGTVTFAGSFLFLDGETAEPATAENIAGRTLIPVDGFCGEHVYWNLEDGVLTISGTGAMADYTYSSPAPWYGLSFTSAVIEDGVTAIGSNAFTNCTTLQSVSIGGDVEAIGIHVFESCAGLTGVTIPDNVTSIGDYAFKNCTGLTGVAVPASVMTLGQHAFDSCKELTEVTVGAESIGKYAFLQCSNLTTLTLLDSVKSIDWEAFENCYNLTNLSLGSGVETIGPYAFLGCSGLESLTLPASVTSIGSSSFENCTCLKTVTAEGLLAIVNESTFHGCSGLETVTFAGGVKTLGGGAFCGFTSLKTVVLGAGTETIGGGAFQQCSKLTSVTIPDTVTSIGDGAFDRCSSLTSVTIPEAVTDVGYGMFTGCTALQSVVLGGSVETIGDLAFATCTSLESLTLPDTVTSIGSSAFASCTNLTSLYIGEGVTSIGNEAFGSCSALTSLHIPAGMTSIGSNAFRDCTNLAYLCSTVADGAAASYCADNDIEFRLCGMHMTVGEITGGTVTVNAPEHLTEGETVTLSATADEHRLFAGWIVTDANGDPVEVAEDGSFTMPASDVTVSASFRLISGATGEVSWRCENDVLTVYGTGAMADYANDSETPWYGLSFTSVVIEDGVTHVGNLAFAGNSALTALTLGNSVESIGDRAFNSCVSLPELLIPASVATIGDYAFVQCRGLTSLTVPATVTSIGYCAFHSCTGLTTLTVDAAVIGNCAFQNCGGLETVTIGDNVKAIGDNAFQNCGNMETLSLGNGVESIGNQAFSYCSSLEAVSIPASVTSLRGYEFERCSSLKTVTFNASVEALGTTFSSCGSLETLTVGGGVQSIPSSAFKDYKNLKTVTIGGSVETIGANAFYGCTSLTSLTVSSSAAIDTKAFSGCAALTNLTLGDGVSFISFRAFENCTALTEVHIPASVTEIIQDAFIGCTNLTCICSPAADGAAATYCADYHIPFRVCGLSVSLNQTAGGTISADKTEDLFSGDTVTLSAAPDGYYSFEGWTVTDANGETVEVAEDGSFTMPESSVTVSATFAAPGPIIITQQPADVSVPLGETASTTVVAEGEGLTYQWYGQDPGCNEFKSGLKGDTYYVTLVSAKVGRQVWCVITDAEGNTVTTRKAALNVQLPEGYAAPRITVQPENATADPGEIATVSLSAEGDTALRYHWFFSNNGGMTWNRSSITTNTYAVEMNDSRKGRLLYCVVSDEYGGQTRTDIVSLDYAYPEGYTGPSIVTEPADAKADPGETASVTVAAAGQGELKYQWYFKNAGSENWTRSSTKTDTYAVEMNASRNGRSLYCVVTDKYGFSVTSAVVTIAYDYPEGYEPPRIIEEPADVFAGAGELASTSFTAVGEGLSYQWFLRASEDAGWSRSSLTGDAYYVTMVAAKSGRQVKCVITDRYGAKVETRVATLTMAVPEGYELRVISQPEDCAVARGERAEATFAVEGAGLTYQWYGLDPGQTEFWTSGIRSATYSVTMVPAKSGRKVYCVVTDAYGNTVRSDTITLSMV